MRAVQQVTYLGFCLALATAAPTAAQDQQNRSLHEIGNPLTAPSVRNAPFSAEATTTIRRTLLDGTPVDQTASARYYRDGVGRVRVEQMLKGLKTPNSPDEQIRITLASAALEEVVYVVQPSTRGVRAGPRFAAELTVGGGDTFGISLGGTRFLVFVRPGSTRPYWDRPDTFDLKEESLGSRRIVGVDTIGRRITVTIPIGQVGNNQPIDIVREQWESPELKIVIEARDVDPRNGTMDYRVTNIQRIEPDPSLFALPADIEPRDDKNWIWLEFADNVRPKPASVSRKR
jgi:hypothetical protein